MTHHDGLPGDHGADAHDIETGMTGAAAVAADHLPTPDHPADDDDSVFPIDLGDGARSDSDGEGEGGYVSSTDRGEDSPVAHPGA